MLHFVTSWSSGPGYLLLGVSCCACLAYLRLKFGPGLEEASKRLTIAELEEERELQKLFKRETQYVDRDGAKLYTQYYYPNVDGRKVVKGVVVFFHGINSHGGRQVKLYNYLLNERYIVAIIDHRGFGRSSGCHGYIESFDDLVKDSIQFLSVVENKFQGEKLFLMGFSMGGLIVAHMLMRIKPNHVAGAIMHAPPFQIQQGVKPSIAVRALGTCLWYLAPKLPLVKSHGSVSNSAIATPIVELSKRSDPLFYGGKLRIGTAFSMLDGSLSILEKYHLVDTPYLLIHGAGDRVCHISGSQAFHLKSSSKDKKYIEYLNAEHNLLHEPDEFSTPFLKDMVLWLNEKCK